MLAGGGFLSRGHGWPQLPEPGHQRFDIPIGWLQGEPGPCPKGLDQSIIGLDCREQSSALPAVEHMLLQVRPDIVRKAAKQKALQLLHIGTQRSAGHEIASLTNTIQAWFEPLWRQVFNLPEIFGKLKTCRHRGL